MTTRPYRKSARGARWSSTGHGELRSDIHLPSQISRLFIEFDATHRPFTSRIVVAQLAVSARTQSTSSPAAPKSP
jgi:hypothetical protein